MTAFRSPRLILRNFRAEDSASLHEYLSLPQTYRFEPGEPIDYAEAERLCLSRSGSDTFLAVERVEDGAMLGHLFFGRSSPEAFRIYELGYIFNPRYQGQGYCSESAKTLVDLAFREWGAHRVEAYCDPENPASWHVLERVGLRREGHFRQKAFFRRDDAGNPLWHDCYAYGLTEDQWRESAGQGL